VFSDASIAFVRPPIPAQSLSVTGISSPWGHPRHSEACPFFPFVSLTAPLSGSGDPAEP